MHLDSDSGNPTDAAWITKDVQLTSGITYTMSWNYVGTDYVPFNDGSITSLIPVSVGSNPVVTVNNSVGSYALLGFTNPGTGDYSTNSFGSTGWQVSTYQVSVTGTYKLGFAVFNLDDTALSPALMIDDQPGNTDRCDQIGANCSSFGGVTPNNPTAPTVPPTVPSTEAPTTTAEVTTTTESTTTTTTTAPPQTTTSTTTTSTTTTSTSTTVAIVIVPPIIQPVETTELPVIDTTNPEEAPSETNEPSDDNGDQASPTTVADDSQEEGGSTTDPIAEEGQTVDESFSDEVTTAIENTLEQEMTPEVVEEILNLVESEGIADEEVSDIVDAILEKGIDEESSLLLATSSKIIENITAGQASEIFAELPVDQLNEEQKEEVTNAVQEAPQEVREAFEEEIDIYAEGFNTYIAVGSVINVQARRSIIAATTVIATAASAVAAASSGSMGGGSSSSSNGSSSSGMEGRSKNEEEGEEPSGEIAGLDDEDDEEYTRNSIFDYYLEGEIWKRKINWFGLFRKVASETAALSFTLAGSVVVFITLSGDTRKTAMIATGVALAVHYVHILLKNDEK